MSQEEFEYDKLSVDAKRTVQAVRGVEAGVRLLQRDYELAIFDLERKWASKFKAAYERRSALLSGSEPATAEEIAAGEKKSRRLNSEYKSLPVLKGSPKPVSLKTFWFDVLYNSPIETYILESDIPALGHLTNVVLSYPPKATTSMPAFRIDFQFSANEFFKNSKLGITFFYKNEVDASGQLEYSHIAADKINWKPKQNLIRKAAGNDDDEDGDESFFSLFEPPSSITSPPPDDDDDDDYREMELSHAFEFGLELKELVLPNAVDYLLGEAEDEDEDEDDDDDDWDGHSVGSSESDSE